MQERTSSVEATSWDEVRECLKFLEGKQRGRYELNLMIMNSDVLIKTYFFISWQEILYESN